MPHDPLCPLFDKVNYPFAASCGCALIARVREDSRQVAIVAVENTRLTAYEQGQRDERQRSVLLIADAYAKGRADALAEVRQPGRITLAVEDAYAKGQRDERERIRAGVTGLGRWYNALRRAEVLAVIDGGES